MGTSSVMIASLVLCNIDRFLVVSSFRNLIYRYAQTFHSIQYIFVRHAEEFNVYFTLINYLRTSRTWEEALSSTHWLPWFLPADAVSLPSAADADCCYADERLQKRHWGTRKTAGTAGSSQAAAGERPRRRSRSRRSCRGEETHRPPPPRRHLSSARGRSRPHSSRRHR